MMQQVFWGLLRADTKLKICMCEGSGLEISECTTFIKLMNHQHFSCNIISSRMLRVANRIANSEHQKILFFVGGLGPSAVAGTVTYYQAKHTLLLDRKTSKSNSGNKLLRNVKF